MPLVTSLLDVIPGAVQRGALRQCVAVFPSQLPDVILRLRCTSWPGSLDPSLADKFCEVLYAPALPSPFEDHKPPLLECLPAAP
jgi:hypothetical protein